MQQNNAVRIIPMGAEQVEGVHRIFEECFTMEKWSLRSIEAELTNPLAVTCTAIDPESGEVVGFINIHHIMGEGDLNDIAVTESFRKKGVGSLLMQEMIRRGREEKISSYMLEVRKSNETAIRFYESFGFVKVGERKDYYTKPVENALLYRLDLEQE